MKLAVFAPASCPRAIASAALVLALAGCAAPQVVSLQQQWPQTLAPAARIDGVPFYPQDDYQCGPAALAMIAAAAGVQVQPEQLVGQVYLPARQGSLQLEMLAAGRGLGLVTHRIRPDLEALLQEVAAGNPVIVLQNLSFQFAPVWHYAVAIGFDRGSNTILLHSGRTEKMEMSLHAFERTWERSGRWAMLAMAPDRLPAGADASAYAASIAALERSSPAAARKAYAAALNRWPADPVLQLGAGNTAYAQGDLRSAVQAYRKLVATHPGIADGWNNLAQALLEQGQSREAMAAIGKAVALGGPRLDSYRQLQQQIQAKR
ncbi:PA2778 family cysteine peptidase [Noviherbaspirillum aerium]|uniref:PA2778 family cysteine peptidase n=1 Tax=Noviherbaspirillum aerium TaxID=2588497 RepID=UPI00124F6B7B|nr:PA2778 family cysteine peptidase [Noviherbaspirillum aerium]